MNKFEREINQKIDCLSGLCKHKPDSKNCLLSKIVDKPDPNEKFKREFIKILRSVEREKNSRNSKNPKNPRKKKPKERA